MQPDASAARGDGVGADRAGAWLTLVGIGEDGVAGLGDEARRRIAEAVLVVGGERQLRLAAPLIRGEARAWPSPLRDGVASLIAWRGRPVVVLASGDPYCFGIGTTLRRLLPDVPLRCLSAPSSFSLACARLGWPLQEITLASLCGRPLSGLDVKLVPGARLLVLSADETTPAKLAAWLVGQGWGGAVFHLLEALGGPEERLRSTRTDAFADELAATGINRLNLVALELPSAARVFGQATREPIEPFSPEEEECDANPVLGF
ncbi:precorrin-6y C5,15-methyltransferase (decarboxylating) subunit CbiE [Rhodocyclus purpureus]|uniref:precorrin-6y C5,15-methyltransferase (decarboxylating) subunit CbiE n=1 Tax=Rhodocyclus purpureus TaxID=1067 RepID=UPI0019122FBE|nr:precorrin-6y C5,15-methyltransferase (decarboxylating) subunit CbiE [Rhodocyclus purpureus]